MQADDGLLTQEQYQLYTGQCTNYDDSNWELLVNIAELRLASFLCLKEFPELNDENQDLAMLLANFMAGVFKFSGDSDTVASKTVRNFTINFKNSASNAFAQIYSQYRDIIEKYTQCELGISVERSRYGCCHGLLNF